MELLETAWRSHFEFFCIKVFLQFSQVICLLCQFAEAAFFFYQFLETTKGEAAHSFLKNDICF